MDLVVQHRGADRARLAQQVLARNNDGHARRADVLLCAAVDDLNGSVRSVCMHVRKHSPERRCDTKPGTYPVFGHVNRLRAKVGGHVGDEHTVDARIRLSAKTRGVSGAQAATQPRGAQTLNSTPPMVSLAQMCTYAASGVKFHELCGGMSASGGVSVRCRLGTAWSLRALEHTRTRELAGLARRRDVDLVVLGCLLGRPAKRQGAHQRSPNRIRRAAAAARTWHPTRR